MRVSARPFWQQLVCGGLALCASAWGQAEVRIELMSYHDHPPFVTGPGQGLTYALAEELNRRGAPDFRFEVKMMPRARMNLMLQRWIKGDCPAADCPDNWVVPWVNPKWGFIKGETDPYRWQPLLDDANEIISLKARPIDYRAADSLVGKRLAGIRGHRYLGIDKLVEAGEIERIDGNRERDNLLKLLNNRVDAVLLPRSTIRFFFENDEVLAPREELFFVAEETHQRYMRYLMVPSNRGDLEHLMVGLDHWKPLVKND